MCLRRQAGELHQVVSPLLEGLCRCWRWVFHWRWWERLALCGIEADLLMGFQVHWLCRCCRISGPLSPSAATDFQLHRLWRCRPLACWCHTWTSDSGFGPSLGSGLLASAGLLAQPRAWAWATHVALSFRSFRPEAEAILAAGGCALFSLLVLGLLGAEACCCKSLDLVRPLGFHLLRELSAPLSQCAIPARPVLLRPAWPWQLLPCE